MHTHITFCFSTQLFLQGLVNTLEVSQVFRDFELDNLPLFSFDNHAELYIKNFCPTANLFFAVHDFFCECKHNKHNVHSLKVECIKTPTSSPNKRCEKRNSSSLSKSFLFCFILYYPLLARQCFLKTKDCHQHQCP